MTFSGYVWDATENKLLHFGGDSDDNADPGSGFQVLVVGYRGHRAVIYGSKGRAGHWTRFCSMKFPWCQ